MTIKRGSNLGMLKGTVSCLHKRWVCALGSLHAYWQSAGACCDWRGCIKSVVCACTHLCRCFLHRSLCLLCLALPLYCFGLFLIENSRKLRWQPRTQQAMRTTWSRLLSHLQRCHLDIQLCFSLMFLLDIILHLSLCSFCFLSE